MRFHSTPQSALNGEITKLAIIECVVSVAIYVSIGVYFGTFRYLAVAVIAAPLMLFRTEASSDWALKVFSRFGDVISRHGGWWVKVVGFVLLPIVGLVTRIVATLFWAVRRPLQTMSEMPQNWLRQSFCTDFFHPPEMLALEATKGDEYEVPTFSRTLRIAREENVGQRIFLLPILLMGYLPALIYRVSFKATAIAYLPLIWVAHTTLRNPMAADIRLKRITKGELERVRRVFSWGIVTTLLAKFGLVLGLVDWNRVEEKFPSQRFVETMVVPGGWPWWQITLGADALLTFFLFFFADAALDRLDGQHAWRKQFVLGTVSTVSFLRAAMSLITISHFFRIALVAVAPDHVQRLLAG